MTDYVLIISVGPVQGFIAAARRSRDLWTGSLVLSEMAKACAKKLHELDATLIFPAPTPANTKEDLTFLSELSVGNKIQVVVKAENSAAVAAIAAQATQAAKTCFETIATMAKAELKNSPLRQHIWDAQVGDYVETQAAWAKIGDDAEGYAIACKKAASTLAARKATRDFIPSALDASQLKNMLPKSSLDGMRETLLPEGKIANVTRRKLGLSESEQLDCAGITKRLGAAEKAEQFTPYPRVAAHAWIDTLTNEEATAICEAYKPLVKPELALATCVKGNDGHFKKLPFDAQFCYPFRLEAAIRDNRNDAEASEALHNLKQKLLPIWRKHGNPCSYGVLLLADGDRMGELLDKAKNIEQHSQITQALSTFAGSVSGIVRQFSGHAIYAGGDDVLAFVPLNQSYACAKALSISFKKELFDVATVLDAKTPTLSVGLAISHIMQPLGDIRALANRAEKVAKGDSFPEDKRRNALGIALDVRGGSETTLRIRWDDMASQDAFKQWLAAYEEKTIPSRVAYDTRAIHLLTKFALEQTENGVGIKIRQAEFSRMLEKTRTSGGEKLTTYVKDALNKRLVINNTGIIIGLEQLADELIVARWMAAKTQLDLGRD